MSTKREDYGLVAYSNSRLYAMGGWTGAGELNSVELYDTLANQWQPVKPMITARREFDAAVIDNSIYVCGGYDVYKKM
ncbi:kelch-like protein 18 [Oppia nitens]|uniref:kelch-like protein 18 n=1 Tax=Oppia nitens TaxID=1686743 RepID=UPI0023DC9F1C|nr:kelch-like protein 18 [Oppia nitens]